MKKKDKNKNSGITLIALVVTVIVLLLLAGISIQMLSGDNGIIKRAAEAKEMTVKKQNEELIKLAYMGAISYKPGNIVTAEDIQKEMDALTGKDKTTVTSYGDDDFDIHFEEDDKNYNLKNGEVTQTATMPKVFDEVPGEFSGSGTQNDEYLIESIEDLVALSTNTNNGENYNGKYFKLTIDLDFRSNNSYVNPKTKYSCDLVKHLMEENENGNEIKTLLTSGSGFIPIGSSDAHFEGNFNGNGHIIYNLFINIQESVDYGNMNKIGLFGCFYNKGTNGLKSLTVTGNINSNKNESMKIGGIVGSYSAEGIEGKEIADIENCKSYVNINLTSSKTYNLVGGICGEPSSVCFYNCQNNGIINVTCGEGSYIGGISSGVHWNDAWVKKCANYGDITVVINGEKNTYTYGGKIYSGEDYVGGITGYLNGALIENSENKAKIRVEGSGIMSVGGIAGYGDSWKQQQQVISATIKNTINSGIISADSNDNDVYIGGIFGYTEKDSKVVDSSNTGTINGNSKTGIIYKNDLIGFEEK